MPLWRGRSWEGCELRRVGGYYSYAAPLTTARTRGAAASVASGYWWCRPGVGCDRTLYVIEALLELLPLHAHSSVAKLASAVELLATCASHGVSPYKYDEYASRCVRK